MECAHGMKGPCWDCSQIARLTQMCADLNRRWQDAEDRLAAARAVIAEHAEAINAARTSLPNPHPIRAALVALVDAVGDETHV